MDQLLHIVQLVKDNGPAYGSAALAILGALKVIARYTPFTWDDKILDTIEAPVNYVIGLFGKKE